MKQCNVKDCLRASRSLNICMLHYRRFRNHGTTELAREEHGLSASTEYEIWSGMKKRCCNKTSNSYRNYGGRGITICERWHTFTNFYNDMGKRPSLKYSLDRINNELGYSPNNCRWATRHEQSANTRRSNETVGVSYRTSEKRWKAALYLNGLDVFSKLYNTKEEAIKARKDAELLYLGYQL